MSKTELSLEYSDGSLYIFCPVVDIVIVIIIVLSYYCP